MLLDSIVLIALLFGIYKGARVGLFVSVTAFLSLGIGVLGALKFSNVLKDFLVAKLNWDSSFLPLLSFVITFFLVLIVVKMIAKAITSVFEALYLGFVNRCLGAAFQILVVILLTSLFISFFEEFNNLFMFVTQEQLMSSYSYRVYLVLSEDLLPSFFNLVQHLFKQGQELIN